MTFYLTHLWSSFKPDDSMMFQLLKVCKIKRRGFIWLTSLICFSRDGKSKIKEPLSKTWAWLHVISDAHCTRTRPHTPALCSWRGPSQAVEQIVIHGCYRQQGAVRRVHWCMFDLHCWASQRDGWTHWWEFVSGKHKSEVLTACQMIVTINTEFIFIYFTLFYIKLFNLSVKCTWRCHIHVSVMDRKTKTHCRI